ncbi:hypothetical protein KIN20_022023 [Parelaphostrongylus tenuis]|uniref:DUF7930 domain-containing protein n=1 Tax=Parelaphostrongylus tenuis TaxID=148309 RepID=A0AAD5QUI8_PARTN|nr:hypothetical protein KIN20_022023 [Parelaphostrongylus tenuis]
MVLKGLRNLAEASDFRNSGDLQKHYMVEKRTLIGRLTRVETKFAYIDTVYGSVFCPLAAAIPPSEHVPNFSLRYSTGDIVHVTMVPQEEKNGCRWRAVKVRPVGKALENDREVDGTDDAAEGSNSSNDTLKNNKIVTITNVTETLAFAISNELGSVFIPGAAFSSEEVTRLNSHLSIGDEVRVSVRAQTDVNGCKWIATSATKVIKCREPTITGCGKILSLTDSHAIVYSITHGEISCSLLSWIGGDGGLDAEWLTDILNIGDTVLYTAVKRGNQDKGWRAVKWTAQGFRTGCDRVLLADSYCQTATSVPEIGMRYILNMLEQKLEEKPTLCRFLS